MVQPRQKSCASLPAPAISIQSPRDLQAVVVGPDEHSLRQGECDSIPMAEPILRTRAIRVARPVGLIRWPPNVSGASRWHRDAALTLEGER